MSGERVCSLTTSIQRVSIEFGVGGYTPVPLFFMLLHVRVLIHVMGANVDAVTNNFIEMYGTRSDQKLIASSI